MQSIVRELELVIETANRYHVSQKTVWKHRKKWNGTATDPADRSRRPRHFPRTQTEEKRALGRRMEKKYGKDLPLGDQKAQEKGYVRRYGCFKRTARQEVPEKVKKHIRKNKPYKRAEYPGRKVQVDVKYVPRHCVMNGRAYLLRRGQMQSR